MKRSLVIVLAVVSACRAVTGAPATAASGTWVLDRFRGQPLPSFFEVAGADSVFLLADTLLLHRDGSYTRLQHFRCSGLDECYFAAGELRGGYEIRGLDVRLTAICNDFGCPPPPKPGRRLGNTLVFPADTTAPQWVYRR